MQGTKKFYLSLMFLVLMAIIMVSGCSSPPRQSESGIEVSHPTLVTIIPDMGPQLNISLNTSKTEHTQSMNQDDINLFFDEIIMRCDSESTRLCNCTGFLDYGPPNHVGISTPGYFENLQYRISLNGLYTNTDISTIQSFIREFNALSSTIEFSPEVSTSKEERIQISFFPPSSMTAISNRLKPEYVTGYYYTFKDAHTQEIMSICTSVGQKESINEGWKGTVVIIYINSELTGDQRNHYIQRSLLYVLGFRGSTSDYPRSIFYSGENSNIKFDSIDWALIREVYGPRLVKLLNNSCWKSS